MLEGKIFCLTGSTGRLGFEAAKRLEELGAEVIPLVLGDYPKMPKRVTWDIKTQPIRISNGKELNDIKRPHYVINFHWEVDRTLSFLDQLSYEINHNVYDLSFFWDWLLNKKIERFVNISTIKVFSHLNENPISIETEPRPSSPYGIAKLTAEKLFDSYFSNTSFSVIHLRLSSVASFGEHPSHLLSRLYDSAFNGKRIILNKGHKVNLSYIDEIIDLIINATINAANDKYLLVKEAYPIEEIATKFERISRKKINALYKNLALGQTDLIFNSNYQDLEVDWVRKFNLDETINRVIELNKINK